MTTSTAVRILLAVIVVITLWKGSEAVIEITSRHPSRPYRAYYYYAGKYLHHSAWKEIVSAFVSSLSNILLKQGHIFHLGIMWRVRLEREWKHPDRTHVSFGAESNEAWKETVRFYLVAFLIFFENPTFKPVTDLGFVHEIVKWRICGHLMWTLSFWVFSCWLCGFVADTTVSLGLNLTASSPLSK